MAHTLRTENSLNTQHDAPVLNWLNTSGKADKTKSAMKYSQQPKLEVTASAGLNLGTRLDDLADCVRHPRLLERLDQSLKLRVKRFGVRRYRRDLAADTQEFVDGHLGRSHRVFHRKDDIVHNFNELADEREIL